MSRVYRSELRRQQAVQTRARVIAAAAELFATQGYAGTTFAKIAAAAGVSPQTVQAHGPKASLLKAAAEYVSLGESDRDDVFDLELGRALMAADDRDAGFGSMVQVLSDMYERGASLWLALSAAAVDDPELRRYHAKWVADITAQGRRLLEVCRDRGWLRDDIPFDDLVTTTAVVTSPETYQRLVHHGGFSAAAYRKWVVRMLNETVAKR
jgi:AcrR family transcriptional regulator